MIDYADAGVSDAEGKSVALSLIQLVAPKTVLDVGAGRGAYLDLAAETVHAHWTAIEAWQPYISEFKLRDRYQRVIHRDVGRLDLGTIGRFDLIVLGDVLEHFNVIDAVWLWHELRKVAPWLLLSIPIVPYPQGAIAGNPFEIHRSDWTHTMVMGLPGIVSSWQGSRIGIYLARGS